MIEKIKLIAEKNPCQTAYQVDDESITYRQLWDEARHRAELLEKQDNTPVVIYGDKEIFVIVTMLACLIAERPYVPVGLSTPLLRLMKIVDMTKSTLVISHENLSIPNVTCCRPDELERCGSQNEKVGKSDIAYIIFTSGSTGEPKGVPITRGNLNNFVNWISRLSPLDTFHACHVLNQASFSFDLSVADLYYSLCNGHTLVAFHGKVQEDYAALFDTFRKRKINVAVMTPTLMKLCLTNDEFRAENYPDFRCVYFCGEVLENRTAKQLLTAFPDLKIINAYGPTEATSAVSGMVITKHIVDTEAILPVGEVSSFATEIEIINDEIVLKGESVFHGYLGGIVGGYYQENGVHCYRTGDLGCIKDGKLYCRGRMDGQVKFKGYRIELSDIENNILQIDGIKDCVVVAKYNESRIVKTIQAFVLTDRDDVNIPYIKNELAKKLPLYMMPKSIKILDEFPINGNGKTDRKAFNQ